MKGQQISRLRERYVTDVVPALQKEFGYKNINAVPKITKVVVNMGLGEATRIGTRVLPDGHRVRISRKTGTVVDK